MKRLTPSRRSASSVNRLRSSPCSTSRKFRSDDVFRPGVVRQPIGRRAGRNEKIDPLPPERIKRKPLALLTMLHKQEVLASVHTLETDNTPRRQGRARIVTSRCSAHATRGWVRWNRGSVQDLERA